MGSKLFYFETKLVAPPCRPRQVNDLVDHPPDRREQHVLKVECANDIPTPAGVVICKP